jgi:hypothetical protein
MEYKKLEYMKYVTSNKTALSESTECGCVYCLKRFNPNEIVEWCCERDENAENSALCPYCGIDSIVPNKLIDYTDNDLKKWHNQGFS